MTKSGFDLDEIERLLERATPGEWESIAEVGVENFANSIYAPAGEWDGLLLARADQNGSTDNAALIVALHNSAPAMLTEIRELRATLDGLAKAEAEYRKAHDLHGDGSPLAGRAWDLMRRAGDTARAALGEPQ